jgi:hypothetical protein
MIDEHDDKTRRCPMLGHELAFSYCRQPGREIPCARIFDCWWERFDIVAFVQGHYDPDTVAEIRKPRQPKVASLVEIIERARKQDR